MPVSIQSRPAGTPVAIPGLSKELARPQGAFTFLAPIKKGRIGLLRAALAAIEEEIGNSATFPFQDMESIHFARLVILDEVENGTGRKFPAQLVFSTNHDGRLDTHLEEVVGKLGSHFHAVFGHCEDCPEESQGTHGKLEFLKKYGRYRAYFYRGAWAKTVGRIRAEEETRVLAEEYLDDRADRTEPAETIRKDLAAYLIGKKALDPEYRPVDPPSLTALQKSGLLAAALLSLPIWIPLVLLGALWLMIRERLEAPFGDLLPKADRIRSLVAREDHVVQNQLSHLVEIKPGPFRGLLLLAVLNSIDFLARFVFNKGRLGNIPSIHFARWVRIDGGRRLLFFSNYDGSWESYLDDFINKAALGLTGVWSNTRLFPRTFLLILKGATDEQRFKAWTRAHQVKTDVWYSAYPNLSILNILNNDTLYRGLCRPSMTNEEAKKLLLKF